jgi:signal peptidase II
MQAARGTPLSEPRPGRPRLALLLLVAVAVLALDIVTKHLAVARLADRGPVDVLDGLLKLRLVRNSGAAFGFASGLTVVLSLVAAIVVIVILRAARSLRSAWWAVGLGMVLGGAVGNLADRIFRPPGLFQGRVVDFLELPHWPVFNVADSSIVCGGILAVLLAARGLQIDGTVPERAARRPGGAAGPGDAGTAGPGSSAGGGGPDGDPAGGGSR